MATGLRSRAYFKKYDGVKLSGENYRHSNNINNTNNPDNTDLDEILAIQKTLQGNKESFSIIVQKYAPIFYTLSYRILGNAEDAEDAVQEIFLRVYKSLTSFRLGQRFYPWIYTIAINCIRTFLKRKKRRSDNEMLQFETSLPGSSPENETRNPSVILEVKEGEKIAQKAIISLKPKYREVFVLRHIEGLSTSDVAEILNIPEGTVKTRLHRAKKEIIKQLFNKGWTNK